MMGLIRHYIADSVQSCNKLRPSAFENQGRPLHWQVEANAFWKTLGESKKWKNRGDFSMANCLEYA